MCILFILYSLKFRFRLLIPFTSLSLLHILLASLSDLNLSCYISLHTFLILTSHLHSLHVSVSTAASSLIPLPCVSHTLDVVLWSSLTDEYRDSMNRTYILPPTHGSRLGVPSSMRVCRLVSAVVVLFCFTVA